MATYPQTVSEAILAIDELLVAIPEIESFLRGYRSTFAFCAPEACFPTWNRFLYDLVQTTDFDQQQRINRAFEAFFTKE